MLGSHGKVVDLMAYRGDSTPPPEFMQMEGYWRALRGPGQSLPERAQFNPRGIAQLLGVTLLLERIAAGEVRIRLAGMALHDLMGMELRGMPLSALAVPGSRQMLAEKVMRVFDTPAIARLSFSGEPGFARPPLSAGLLLLPMIGPSGRVDRALGALVGNGLAGRSPRRLVLERAQIERIADLAPETAQSTAPAGLPPLLLGAPDLLGGPPARPADQPMELAEEAPPFAPRPPAGPRAPHLRLVKG